jgi:hypothetical protein
MILKRLASAAIAATVMLVLALAAHTNAGDDFDSSSSDSPFLHTTPPIRAWEVPPRIRFRILSHQALVQGVADGGFSLYETSNMVPLAEATALGV